MANLPTVGADIGIWGTELNNYMLVGHDSSGHHKAVFSVKEYGALCDGATDDTSAWQAAIAACQSAGGGTVLHPGGNSIIASTLTISADNVQIVGTGWGSIITAKAGWSAGTYMVSVQAPGGGNVRYGIKFADIFLNGNSVAGVNGIQLDTTYNALIQHVRMRYIPGTAINLIGSSPFGAYTQIVDCNITDGGAGKAIATNNHEWNTMRGCTIAWYNTAGGVGIYLTNGNNVIDGCTLDECDTGIYLNFTHSNSIINNQFDAGLTRYIYMHGAEFTRILGNYFGTFNGAGSQAMIVVDGGSSNFQNIIAHNQVSSYGTQWAQFVSEGGGLGSPANLYLQNETLSVPSTLNNGIMRGNRGYNPVIPLATPAAPTVNNATTGGTVAAGTYGVKITLVNAFGETIASSGTNTTTTTGTSTITITAPGGAGVGNASGWYAYVTQAGGATYTRQQAVGSPSRLGANLTLTAPPTNTGATAPASNTTAGITQPAVPASGTVFTNTFHVDCTVYVTGGTVSAIAVNGQTTGLTSGAIRVPANSTVTLTYSVAPTWQWVGE